MSRSRYWQGLVAHVVAIIAVAMSALELAFEGRWIGLGLALAVLLWAFVSLFVHEVRAGHELDR